MIHAEKRGKEKKEKGRRGEKHDGGGTKGKRPVEQYPNTPRVCVCVLGLRGKLNYHDRCR